MIFFIFRDIRGDIITLRYENKFTGEKGYYKKGIRDENHKVTYKKRNNNKKR